MQEPVYLIYTHGHYDHIGATTPLRQAGAKAILPREDRDLVGYDILKKIPASFDAACTGKGE